MKEWSLTKPRMHRVSKSKTPEVSIAEEDDDDSELPPPSFTQDKLPHGSQCHSLGFDLGNLLGQSQPVHIPDHGCHNCRYLTHCVNEQGESSRRSMISRMVEASSHKEHALQGPLQTEAALGAVIDTYDDEDDAMGHAFSSPGETQKSPAVSKYTRSTYSDSSPEAETLGSPAAIPTLVQSECFFSQNRYMCGSVAHAGVCPFHCLDCSSGMTANLHYLAIQDAEDLEHCDLQLALRRLRTPLSQLVDRNGWNALFHAIDANQTRNVKHLLDADASLVRSRLGEDNVLHFAITHHASKEICQLLLQSGVDVRERNLLGYSSIELAVANGRMQLASFMLPFMALQ